MNVSKARKHVCGSGTGAQGSLPAARGVMLLMLVAISTIVGEPGARELPEGIALPLTFFEDGTARFGKTELARYRPATPLHLEFAVDVPNLTCTARCDDGEPLTVKWDNPRAARFQHLRLDGLLPGGHARAPGQLAFDNIKITMEK